MKFSLAKSLLLSDLFKVQGIIDKKSTFNILGNVKITAKEDGALEFRSTDFDLSYFGLGSATVELPGEMVVSGKILFDAVKLMPEGDVTINKMENEWIEILGGSSRFQIAGFPIEDFPKIMDFKDFISIDVPVTVLNDMIDSTIFSISQDESRRNINGVFLTFDQVGSDIKLEMVSTDGHRLSKTERMLPGVLLPQNFRDSILHRKALMELKRLFEGEEIISIGFADKAILFKTRTSTLAVRPIEEVFPDYKKVIPGPGDVVIELGVSRFTEAIKRVSLLNTMKIKNIKVEVAPGKVTLRSSNPDLGEATDVIPITYDGKTLNIGFNYRYFIDILGGLREESFLMELTDEFSAGVVRPKEDDKTIFIIMPIKL